MPRPTHSGANGNGRTPRAKPGTAKRQRKSSFPLGKYTGANLLRDRPQIYEAVSKLLVEPGVSIRRISRVCHVSEDAIQAVALAENIPLHTRKQQIANLTSFAARHAIENISALLEDGNDISARDTAVIFGICCDKLRDLSGDPTARIEVTHLISGNDLLSRIASLQQTLQTALPAPSTPATVLEAELVA